jgi:dephospho-CoA kinase
LAPLAVAITGGIGAGKTEALRAFERRGVPVRSSDETVHRLISDDAEVRAALQERLATTDRAKIAQIVFGDWTELVWLESLLHPRVREDTLAWRHTLDADVCAVEVPLLYETGGETAFDVVVAITAPEGVRAARTDVPLERSRRLLPDEEKVRRADFSYVNDGSLAELDAFVGRVLEDLRARLHADT